MVQDIIEWRESLTRLPDHHFFDLMRMYLGEIKTPFNKQKLIEALSAFLRKPENREVIIGLLDDTDILILSAICFLPLATQEKLSTLFSGTFSFPYLYERLLNLEERLILFRTAKENKQIIAINPLLADAILPLTKIHILLPEVPFPEESSDEPPPITGVPLPVEELTMAAFLSFIGTSKDILKNDGTFKKRAEEELSALFPPFSAYPETLMLFVNSLRNLSLVRQEKGALVPDMDKWHSFAALPQVVRYAYLCASSRGRFTRDVLQQQAQLALNIIFSMPPRGGYTEPVMYRSGFIQTELNGMSGGQAAGGNRGTLKEGRFAAFLRSEPQKENRQPPAISGKLLIDSALGFGLIIQKGTIYYRNPTFTRMAEDYIRREDVPRGTPETHSGNIHTDGSFSVTILPGIPFEKLLDTALFLEIRSADTAARFELTRTSCQSGFDKGFTPEKIRMLLESGSRHPLPQNVLFSIDEWYRNYKSIALYHGFILQVEESRRVYVENNDSIASAITAVLAPGIYLLNAETADEASELLRRSGIDFSAGTVRLANGESALRDTPQLPPLRVDPFPPRLTEKSAAPRSYAQVSHSLYSALEHMSVSAEQEEELRSRIDRRIVITPAQLRPESVRYEKLEAGGMDFLGKVRVAEHAIAADGYIEITYEQNEEKLSLFGKPVSIEKQDGDAILHIILKPDERKETCSLGRASLVKRIRGALFKELSYD